ncbi:MAG: sulfurtransferase-like selenium metabolism protein YedF [Bacillota bacterium]|nr:sulfurtransferase-like selenium metabolism protein YedF [Bacillota bacterium]
MKQRIAVIGMPLSGKSSVYRRIAERVRAYELDAEIERRANRSITDLFAEQGEEGFRAWERETLRMFLSSDIPGSDSERADESFLLFTGGGAVKTSETRALLRRFDRVVFLRTSIAALLSRLTAAEAEKRPLLRCASPEDALVRLYQERAPYYEQIATDIIDTDDRSISEIAEELIKINQQCGGYMRETIVEARGMNCPIPVVNTIKAIGAMTEPGVIETHVDNRVAVQNLLMMAKTKGYNASSKTAGEKHFVVRIEVSASEALRGQNALSDALSDVLSKEDASPYRGNISVEKTVVVFSSEFMGHGSDELGALLMKGFIYTLTQLEKKPDCIIFYNSGVKLAVEGPQLEDLKKLEAEGVELLSCGTCLDYYDLKDRPVVGNVSNMYTILETLSAATKILRP